jgi:eukaryotic-like serine/threonine-protein kinase
MDRTIAHYNLLERVGEGALGEVYRARDTKFGRTVALKLLSDASFTDAATRAALLEDARAAAALSHPNIAILFDVGEYDGGCYLAYEFASGVTLRQESGARAVHPRRVVELGVQIADALADAHAHGILHTDLRPETIVVTQKGNAKILDFGMAKWTRGGMTRACAVNGADALGSDAITTVSHMSPEQALGGQVDPRTDVFSLGVILYEMLTGRNPFAGASPAQTLLNVISAPVPVGSGSDLDAIVLRAMAKEIDKRHQSAASFSAELRSVGAILDVRAGDSPPADFLPLDDEGGSGKWWAVAAIVMAALAIGWWYWSRP